MDNKNEKTIWRQVYECRKCAGTACRFVMLRDKKPCIPDASLRCIAYACKGDWALKCQHQIPEVQA